MPQTTVYSCTASSQYSWEATLQASFLDELLVIRGSRVGVVRIFNCKFRVRKFKVLHLKPGLRFRSSPKLDALLPLP